MSVLPTGFELGPSFPLTAPKQPPITGSDFREVMSHLAATVTVVTAIHDGERRGRTATAVLPLAPEPPSILVSIDGTSRLADLIAASGRFSLAVLATDQRDVGDAFAGKLGKIDRFSVGDWSEWPSGDPLLANAVSAIDCEVIGRMDTGTHILFAGGIVESRSDESRQALLWHRRGYRGIELSAD
ncbi:flavin reductase family protein [Devosia pacifica]|nr:flavin reductase family protein [Devosia pacifica]